MDTYTQKRIMESIFEPQNRTWYHRLMTSCEKVDEDEFLRIVSASYELRRFANTLTSDSDIFVEIIRDKVGLNRVMRILGISDDINTILFYPIMIRFHEIMTHEHGNDLASRVLDVCNIHVKNMFCQITYRHVFVLAHDENGCSIIKKAITIAADDLFKSDFLDLIAQHADLLSTDDLGSSLIQHVLNLDFTKRTTEEDDEDTRLHELMAEFDEILPTSDTVELHKLVLKLTSDSDLFAEFVKTKRGSLMAQIILGKSEEIDTVFWEAIRQSYTDVATSFYGHLILERNINVLEKRGKSRLAEKIQRLNGYNALYLAKEPNMGNFVVQHAIDLHDSDCTELIACGLQCHYIELSFLKHGSNIVAKLLGEDEELPLLSIVTEIVKCDEDTLVRLAKDEYGNGVLKKTLQVAKDVSDDFFGDLVDKLRPFLDSLRGSRGENITAIINELE